MPPCRPPSLPALAPGLLAFLGGGPPRLLGPRGPFLGLARLSAGRRGRRRHGGERLRVRGSRRRRRHGRCLLHGRRDRFCRRRRTALLRRRRDALGGAVGGWEVSGAVVAGVSGAVGAGAAGMRCRGDSCPVVSGASGVAGSGTEAAAGAGAVGVCVVSGVMTVVDCIDRSRIAAAKNRKKTAAATSQIAARLGRPAGRPGVEVLRPVLPMRRERSSFSSLLARPRRTRVVSTSPAALAGSTRMATTVVLSWPATALRTTAAIRPSAISAGVD